MKDDDTYPKNTLHIIYNAQYFITYILIHIFPHLSLERAHYSQDGCLFHAIYSHQHISMGISIQHSTKAHSKFLGSNDDVHSLITNLYSLQHVVSRHVETCG